jgi:hypothetical protein
MGLRLVAKYFDRHEAYVAQATLDAAGVPAFLHGELITNLHPIHLLPLSLLLLLVFAWPMPFAYRELRED